MGCEAKTLALVGTGHGDRTDSNRKDIHDSIETTWMLDVLCQAF
jgi:hypothetical protein